MRVLLVGGAGYIGSHVSLAFLDKGHEVGVLDNLSSGVRENVHEGSQFFEGDIMDRKRLSDVCAKGWDAIVHLAAFKAAGESMIEPEKYSVNNICGSLNLMIESVRHDIRHFILSSSAAVYGEPRYLPIDEQHPTDPTNYYGFTKLEIERNLAWYEKLRGLRYASLRYFNAAGYDSSGRVTGLEKNPANLVPVIMEVAAGIREELLIFGDDYETADGTGIRDYIHVTDLAEAHVAALEYTVRTDSSLIVNLGSESGLSVLDILETSRRLTGRPIPSRVTGRRAGDPARLVASSKRAGELMGWKARHSSAEDLISTTWNLYSHLS
ncbi:MAG: UDP-glucose 4-epimerase GalE [Spirochaetota bacterium]|nr:UDP-glucose 4-epimerase GalE [Spirochaetota bacterium]